MKTILSIVSCLLFVSLHSQSDIRVDSSFGVNGMALASISGGIPTAVNWQEIDGKILFGGAMVNNQVFVGRLTNDGIVDSTFGTNGFFSMAIGSYGRGVKGIKADGNTISLIFEYARNQGAGLAVLHLTENGEPDTSFSQGGLVSNDMIDLINNGSPAVERYYSGKSLTGNTLYQTIGGIPNYTGAIHRLTFAGGLDSIFGINGRLRLDSIDQIGGVRSLKMEFDTSQFHFPIRLFAAGIGDSAGCQRVIIYKVDPSSGVIDNSFGTNGISTITFRTPEGYLANATDASIEVLDDGKILVAAPFSYGAFHYKSYIRLLENGQLDLSFGQNGFATEDAGFESSGYASLISLDGRFVNAGRQSNANYPVEILSYKSNGSVDSSVYCERLNGGLSYGQYDVRHSPSAQYSQGCFTYRPTNNAIYLGLAVWDGISSTMGIVKLRIDGDPAAISETQVSAPFELFPNPATDQLTIKATIPSHSASIRIYGADGREFPARSVSKSDGQMQLSIADLPDGIYLLRLVVAGHAPVSRMFVKSR